MRRRRSRTNALAHTHAISHRQPDAVANATSDALTDAEPDTVANAKPNAGAVDRRQRERIAAGWFPHRTA